MNINRLNNGKQKLKVKIKGNKKSLMETTSNKLKYLYMIINRITYLFCYNRSSEYHLIEFSYAPSLILQLEWSLSGYGRQQNRFELIAKEYVSMWRKVRARKEVRPTSKRVKARDDWLWKRNAKTKLTTIFYSMKVWILCIRDSYL